MTPAFTFLVDGMVSPNTNSLHLSGGWAHLGEHCNVCFNVHVMYKNKHISLFLLFLSRHNLNAAKWGDTRWRRWPTFRLLSSLFLPVCEKPTKLTKRKVLPRARRQHETWIFMHKHWGKWTYRRCTAGNNSSLTPRETTTKQSCSIARTHTSTYAPLSFTHTHTPAHRCKLLPFCQVTYNHTTGCRLGFSK